MSKVKRFGSALKLPIRRTPKGARADLTGFYIYPNGFGYIEAAPKDGFPGVRAPRKDKESLKRALCELVDRAHEEAKKSQ